jgi:DNA (cytosine-5)-methyltransferase 1
MEKDEKKITFVDLFAGIGGFHLGIAQAAKKLGIDTECVLAVDINPNARATYSGYFKGTPVLNDITDPVVKDSIPCDVDIICGGFPCQPFSQAGKKMGIEDDRGTLFKHIVEVLERKRPKAVFLENVQNLKNIKNGDGTYTFDVIKKALRDAGYAIHGGESPNDWTNHRVYRATDFGLPTHRPRIYMVGFRKDILANPQGFVWPNPSHVAAPTLAGYFRSLPKVWDGRVERDGWPDRVGNTLRVGGVGSGFRDGGRRRDRRNWDSYMLHEDDESRRYEHRLSVNEAKAMMGFPVGFRFGEGLSDIQAMKQLGNSVAVPVIRAIAESIIRTIHDRQDHT